MYVQNVLNVLYLLYVMFVLCVLNVCAVCTEFWYVRLPKKPKAFEARVVNDPVWLWIVPSNCEITFYPQPSQISATTYYMMFNELVI